MNPRHLIALALLRVVFPKYMRKARAVVVLPIEESVPETSGSSAPVSSPAWLRPLRIDPWHPTLPGQCLVLERWDLSLRIPKRSIQESEHVCHELGADLVKVTTNA